MIGFGIDPAGYTQQKTSLAAIRIDGGRAYATLLWGSSFSKKHRTSASTEIVADEVAVLRRCLAVGPLAIDVPLDLQGLPFPQNPKEIWELTRRPVDKALNAFPPFADRMGSTVARFAAIMRVGGFESILGEQLFETYPAEAWKRLGIIPGKYKKSSDELFALCKKLGMTSNVKNDDDLDAIICEITAVAPVDHTCNQYEYDIAGSLPKGFRILKKLDFLSIEVDSADFEKWMEAHEPK